METIATAIMILMWKPLGYGSYSATIEYNTMEECLRNIPHITKQISTETAEPKIFCISKTS